ncbi:MAG: hypothetical protein ACLRWM_12145 [Streptococcus sp.]
MAIRAWISEHFTSAMTDNTLQAGKERRKNIIILNTDGKLEESDSTTMTSQTNVMGQFIRFPEGIRYFEPYTGELVKNRMIYNDKNMLLNIHMVIFLDGSISIKTVLQ